MRSHCGLSTSHLLMFGLLEGGSQYSIGEPPTAANMRPTGTRPPNRSERALPVYQQTAEKEPRLWGVTLCQRGLDGYLLSTALMIEIDDEYRPAAAHSAVPLSAWNAGFPRSPTGISTGAGGGCFE